MIPTLLVCIPFLKTCSSIIQLFVILQTEITKAYAILGNIDTRRQYDKDTGTYYIMRSSPKKGSGQKVLRLTDDALEIDMYKIDEVCFYLGESVVYMYIKCIKFDILKSPDSAKTALEQLLTTLHKPQIFHLHAMLQWPLDTHNKVKTLFF